ncbi:MAG: hypothetical protein IJY62_05550 [Clostridia bacterium]|nr:hypothetical protein [Clostridia bacterium]
MLIDIITYTDEQFAALTEEQIREVESVQTKKNRLTEALEADKRAEKFKLVKKGIFRSAVFEKLCAELEEAYSVEVENLREGLLFYLRFTTGANGLSAPYAVNFALTYEERAKIVKEYYDSHYAEPTERFEAFKGDGVAKTYLGEYYSLLFDYFYLQIE